MLVGMNNSPKDKQDDEMNAVVIFSDFYWWLVLTNGTILTLKL